LDGTAWSQSVEDVEPRLLECARLVQYVTAAKENIKLLLLDSLVLALEERNVWSREDCKALAIAIASLARI
jgi:hypothetical protein